MTPLRSTRAILPLLFSTLLTGCGKSIAIPNFPSQPITGNWSINGNYSFGSTARSTGIYDISIGGSIINSKGQLSGVFHVYNLFPPNCFSTGTLDFPYTGTLSNNDLQITSSPANGQVLTMQGTISSDGSTLTHGYFTITGGCAGSLVSLTGPDGPGASYDPTGLRLNPLTGTWVPLPPNSLNLTEQLTQSPTPDAHGDFALSGTVVVAGSSCFTHGTLQPASFISGELGQQVILMNDGSTISAPMHLTPQSPNPTPIIQLYPGTITGGNCNGPIDLYLQLASPP